MENSSKPNEEIKLKSRPNYQRNQDEEEESVSPVSPINSKPQPVPLKPNQSIPQKEKTFY
jgi:hypothetical protein